MSRRQKIDFEAGPARIILYSLLVTVVYSVMKEQICVKKQPLCRAKKLPLKPDRRHKGFVIMTVLSFYVPSFTAPRTNFQRSIVKHEG